MLNGEEHRVLLRRFGPKQIVFGVTFGQFVVEPGCGSSGHPQFFIQYAEQTAGLLLQKVQDILVVNEFTFILKSMKS